MKLIPSESLQITAEHKIINTTPQLLLSHRHLAPAFGSHPPRIATGFLPALSPYTLPHTPHLSLSHQPLTSDANQYPEAVLDYAVCALLKDRRKVLPYWWIVTVICGTRWTQYVRITRRPGGPSRRTVMPLRHAQAWRWVPARKTWS
jgi:hypothetical protein